MEGRAVCGSLAPSFPGAEKGSWYVLGVPETWAKCVSVAARATWSPHGSVSLDLMGLTEKTSLKTFRSMTTFFSLCILSMGVS